MVKTKSAYPVRAAKVGYIVMSLVLCALGIVLILCPGISASVLAELFGGIMIIFGGVKLVGYFSKDLFRLAFQYDLSFGILMIALGAVVMFRPEKAIGFICVVLGIIALCDALFKVQIVLDSKKFGIRLWWLNLILAVMTGIAGILLILRPMAGASAVMVLFGVSCLAEGILNLSTVLTSVKIVRHQVPDVIETEDFEIHD